MWIFLRNYEKPKPKLTRDEGDYLHKHFYGNSADSIVGCFGWA
jgi:hypothetical protein